MKYWDTTTIKQEHNTDPLQERDIMITKEKQIHQDTLVQQRIDKTSGYTIYSIKCNILITYIELKQNYGTAHTVNPMKHNGYR